MIMIVKGSSTFESGPIVMRIGLVIIICLNSSGYFSLPNVYQSILPRVCENLCASYRNNRPVWVPSTVVIE